VARRTAAVPPAFEVDDHLASHRESGVSSAILFDHRHRQIDARRNSGGCVERPVFDEDRIRVDLQPGEALRDVADSAPVRGDSPAVQQPSRCEAVDAGTHAGDAADARSTTHDPFRGSVSDAGLP
jgi:hypothetical protein